MITTSKILKNTARIALMNSINELKKNLTFIDRAIVRSLLYAGIKFIYSAFSDISPFSGDLGASRHADCYGEPCAFQCRVRWILLLEAPFYKD